MTKSDTEQCSEMAPGLPMVLEAQRQRPSLARSQISASFVSQLLAARQNLAPQRVRRRSSVDGALDAYRSGASISVVRMPQGYRKSLTA